jgi:hypothetical protein
LEKCKKWRIKEETNKNEMMTGMRKKRSMFIQ